MPPSAERHEVVVVGVGGVGSAATYHLAQRGVDVVGLERFDVPHARGSSHGRTRLMHRLVDAEQTVVDLADRAREHWRALERETGRELVTETGVIAVGPEGDDPVASARRVCERQDYEFEFMTGAECTDRFPVYDFPDDCGVVYRPEGGVLAAEDGVVAHVAAALEAGASVRARERVVDWRETAAGVRVETDREVYVADALVVAAGGWAGRLVEDLADLVEPCRHATAWFGPTAGDGVGGSEPSERGLPPAFVASIDGEDYYGMPGPDLPGLKVGRSDFEPTAPDDLVEPTQADERPLGEFARQYVPGAAGPPLRLHSGLVTRSPDGRFLLDTLPETERVAVAAGLSGRGYMVAPALGEALADLATDGATDFEIDPYAIDRFD